MNLLKILCILWTFGYSKLNIKNHFLLSNVKAIKTFSIAVGTSALIFTNQPDASALSSGSRSGGSSFRSSSQTFTSPRYNTRMYTQSYSPLYIPFSYVPVNFDVVVVGAVSYVVFQVVSNGIRGSLGFLGNEDSKSTIIKLQIAVDSDWSQQGNIIENLNEITSKYSSFNKPCDIADLLSKASLVILRKSSDWNSASYQSEMLDIKKAELYFQKLTIIERAKYDKEIIPSSIQENNADFYNKTQVVVSLIVAIKGSSDAYRKKEIITIAELRSCLESLAYEALNDSGENIMAVELSWSPSERGTLISDRDLIQDYPELMKL
jgi:uncharacterized membrane protein